MAIRTQTPAQARAAELRGARASVKRWQAAYDAARAETEAAFARIGKPYTETARLLTIREGLEGERAFLAELQRG